MKVLSVCGISGSGKTTTIENIIRELKKRRYSVGSIKDIHFEDFAIDQKGTNTYRHREAGSELVTALGYHETDILYPERLPVTEILKHYQHDYVIIEGDSTGNYPRILAAHTTQEIEERLDGSVFAISGRIASDIDEYQGIPVINSLLDSTGLVDLIEEKIFEKLPDFTEDCCAACGYNCRELLVKILKGEARREDCLIADGNIKLFFNQKELEIVPFVQRLLKNAIMGVVSELDGYQAGCSIEVRVGSDER